MNSRTKNNLKIFRGMNFTLNKEKGKASEVGVLIYIEETHNS